MKRFAQTALALGLALTVTACAGDRQNEEQAPTVRDNSAAARDNAVGTSGMDADRGFIEDQLEDGHAEITLGRLAQQRASHPDVKEFAAMMVREHQMAGEELRQIATQGNLKLEPVAENLDGDHKDLQDNLMKLSGREFDRQYIDAMVDEHEEAVNEVEKKIDDQNSVVRAWAQKTLPKLQAHLEKARQLDKTLEQAANR